MKRKFKAGLTSVSLPVFIADTSSTTGGGLSGVTSASSGLVLEYRRAGQSSWTSVTPVAGKTLGTYLSGGIVADGSLSGAYEVDFPDAAFASGVRMVVCRIRGVTNMLASLIEIELDAVDYQDSAAFGLSRLASAGTAGSVGTGVTLAATTHTGAVIPTVTAVTNAVTLPSAATINITGNITGNVTGSVGSVTGNVGGNVSGSVGSIANVTFPTNFASMSIDSSGRVLLQPTQTGVTIPTVTSLTNSVTVGGYAAGQAPLQPTVAGRTLDVTAAGAAGIDWGNVENQGAVVQLTNTLIDQAGSVAGPVGEITGVTFPTHFENLVIAANGHVTATVDSINNNAITASSIQANALTAAKFAVDSITASALATDAVNEVRDAVAAITPIADLATMITNDGTANARYTVSALQNGPSGAGGSTINVYPVSASTPERVAGTTITYYRDENRAVSVVTDFVLDALTLEFVVEDSEGTDLLVIADGSISKSNKTFTVTIGTTVTATISNYRWSLRDITSGSNSVIARGVLSVQEAASNG